MAAAETETPLTIFLNLGIDGTVPLETRSEAPVISAIVDALKIPCWKPVTVRLGGDAIAEDGEGTFEEHGIEDEATISVEVGDGVFDMVASTTNGTDGNVTISRTSVFQVSDYGDVACRVLWGGGSVHDTYDMVICELTGTVSKDEDAANANHLLFVGQTTYSNGPQEDWSGRLMLDPATKEMTLVGGRYVWHGWGRSSDGALDMKLVPVDDMQAHQKNMTINEACEF